jgi:O-antigen ligase
MIERAPEPPFSLEVTQALMGIEQVAACAIAVVLVAVLWQPLGASIRSLRRPALAVAAGLAVFAASFAWMAGSFGFEGAPLAAALSAGLVLGFASPVFALSFSSVVLLLRPWEIVGGDAVLLALPRIFALTIVISWATSRAREGALKLRFGWEEALFLGFALWAYMSVLVAPNWSESHDVYVNSFSRAIVLYLFVLQVVRTPRDVFALTVTLGLGGAALAALTAYRLAFDPLLLTRSRAELFGLLGDPNDLSAMLLLALPMLLHGVGRLPVPPMARLLASAAIVLSSVWMIVLTQSRGAIVGFLALVFAFGLTRIRDIRKVLALIVLMAVLGVGLMSSLRRSSDDLSSSQASRIAYWKAGWAMALRNPIIGVGFGGYPYRFQEFIRGGSSEAGMRTAHSTWVLALAETGFVGFGLLGALFLLALRRAWSLRDSYPYLFVSLAGYGAAATFLSHTYLLQPYLLMGLVLAAWRADRDARLAAKLR